MITIYSKEELRHFIMTHSMINSDYSPPLERKGGIYLIFEKGDKIIITGGFPNTGIKTTNFMKIEEI